MPGAVWLSGLTLPRPSRRRRNDNARGEVEGKGEGEGEGEGEDFAVVATAEAGAGGRSAIAVPMTATALLAPPEIILCLSLRLLAREVVDCFAAEEAVGAVSRLLTLLPAVSGTTAPLPLSANDDG